MDVQTQLVFNLEEAQEWYKENANEHWKEQPNFKVKDQILLQQHIKITRSSENLDH